VGRGRPVPSRALSACGSVHRRWEGNTPPVGEAPQLVAQVARFWIRLDLRDERAERCGSGCRVLAGQQDRGLDTAASLWIERHLLARFRKAGPRCGDIAFVRGREVGCFRTHEASHGWRRIRGRHRTGVGGRASGISTVQRVYEGEIPREARVEGVIIAGNHGSGHDGWIPIARGSPQRRPTGDGEERALANGAGVVRCTVS